MLDFPPIHGLEQGFARGEVAVERADTDTGAFGDGFETCIGAARAEDALRRFQHALAIACGVRARLAVQLYRMLSHTKFLSRALPVGKWRVSPFSLQSGGALRIV